MYKPSTTHNNGNGTPSAPELIENQREDFADGNQPAFINHGFQDDVNQKSFSDSPQQTVNTRFMPHQPDVNDSYCGRLAKNRRQASSVSGGLLLMINSGLHIGWGVWRTDFEGRWIWTVNLSLFIFLIMAWSVGAFIGGFLGAILTPILRKASIYHLSGAIMIVGNVLIITLEQYAEAVSAGRIVMGLAHGIAYVTLITHAGENAARDMRATILSIVNCMLYTGIFVSVVIAGTYRFDFQGFSGPMSVDRIVGLVGVGLGLVSICLTMFLTVESVPFLLHENNLQNAMPTLKRLRGTSHETLAVSLEMEELTLMVAQDKRDNWNIFIDGNGRPLVLLILMRLMVALTNNFLINIVAFAFVTQMIDGLEHYYVPLVYIAPRLGMSILQIFYADVLKRKVQLIISSVLASITLIVIGIVFNTVEVFSFDQLRASLIALGSLWLIFQFSCSIGMDQMQDVYLSEAFSTAKKRWSLPFVVGIEHMFHIFMIGLYFIIFAGCCPGVNFDTVATPVIFASAGVILFFGILLIFLMPETQNSSPKQARDMFLENSVHFTTPFA
ncbi:arabinose-proton symporter-like [Bradysia coprophila]|uniref:arabinose-proton symporter-like n=1 Tax=Bradysia coprophila TaxID=38358 RepID=UPI00187DA6FB|nr:arabinose-proton symporter-like [Bradysia coprophila]